MGKSPESQKCWICGNDATTRDHTIKRTDVDAVLGNLSQNFPAFLSTETRRNKIIQSDNSVFLKSKSLICNNCNSSLTQPFDIAWEQMSAWLQKNSKTLADRDYFRATRIFPYNTKTSLLQVHLFFVKLFGGQLVDAGAKLDISSYSNSLKAGVANPNFYFGIGASNESLLVLKRDNLVVWETQSEVRHARNILTLGNIVVLMCHAEREHEPNYIKNLWHPSVGTSRFKIVKNT